MQALARVSDAFQDAPENMYRIEGSARLFACKVEGCQRKYAYWESFVEHFKEEHSKNGAKPREDRHCASKAGAKLFSMSNSNFFLQAA